MRRALFAIANQCPMVDGNAVFRARSLYTLVDDAYEFDDVLLCLPHGIVVKSLQAVAPNAVSMVPNPASDEATLVLTQPLETPGTLVLYDVLGAEVLRCVIPLELARHTFSTAKIAPGPYHYKVMASGAMLGGGKLTIMR